MTARRATGSPAGNEVARQERLVQVVPRERRGLIEGIRQLSQRYGGSPVYHVVPVEPWSRIAERRYALLAYEP